jgi:hypothetical protein
VPGGPADRVQPRVRRPGYRASPNFMGLTSFGLEIGIFCDFRYSVLLLNAILGLDFLGRALSRPQVRLRLRALHGPVRRHHGPGGHRHGPVPRGVPGLPAAGPYM